MTTYKEKIIASDYNCPFCGYPMSKDDRYMVDEFDTFRCSSCNESIVNSDDMNEELDQQ